MFELAEALRRHLPEAAVALLCAALLFAVHPLRVESVAWVTERRDVLSAPFFVLSVLCWLRWGRAVPVTALALVFLHHPGLRGLVVPVVKDTNNKSIIQIAEG